MITSSATTPTKAGPAACAPHSVSLRGPAGRLEALVNEGAPQAPFAALVCHPHPLAGGTMHNKVVYHAMKALNSPEWGLCWPVLRFNFRGTGLSQGSYDGQAEAGDVLAALGWLENEYHRPLALVGFSFGAAMALSACCSSPPALRKVRLLALLGLPIQVPDFSYCYPDMAECAISKLFLSGAEDQYAPAAQLASTVAAAAEPKQLVLLPRTDHFFTGQLEPMQSALAGWLKEQLP